MQPLGMSGVPEIWLHVGLWAGRTLQLTRIARDALARDRSRALNVATSCELPCNAPACCVNFLWFGARDSVVEENSYNNWSLPVPYC